MARDHLERLVEAHQASIYRYLRFLGAQPASAEDLTQETFLAVLRPGQRRPGSEDDPRWNAWFRGVARNLFLADCRRRRRDAVSVDEIDLERAEALWAARCATDASWQQQLEALNHCLAALPSRQREMVEHRYARRLGRDEMAREFGMTEDGIKTALRRIRTSLAECISERCQLTERR